MNVWKYEVFAPTMSPAKKDQTQWKPDSHSSLAGVLAEWSWKEKQKKEEEKVFFFFTLNISPWFCQSVLIQPFLFPSWFLCYSLWNANMAT